MLHNFNVMCVLYFTQSENNIHHNLEFWCPRQIRIDALRTLMNIFKGFHGDYMSSVC